MNAYFDLNNYKEMALFVVNLVFGLGFYAIPAPFIWASTRFAKWVRARKKDGKTGTTTIIAVVIGTTVLGALGIIIGTFLFTMAFVYIFAKTGQQEDLNAAPLMVLFTIPIFALINLIFVVYYFRRQPPDGSKPEIFLEY